MALTSIGFMGLWTGLTAGGLVEAAGRAHATSFDTVLTTEHPYMVSVVFFGWLVVVGQYLWLGSTIW